MSAASARAPSLTVAQVLYSVVFEKNKVTVTVDSFTFTKRIPGQIDVCLLVHQAHLSAKPLFTKFSSRILVLFPLK